MTTIILGIFEEGLVYAIMALGVYITYRILDFPDLSVDGTFPLGAAFTATGIAGGFIHPAAALPLSFLLGAMAGCVTGLIHVKLKVRDLLSGIIVMTALYSINLRVAGKSNLPIFSKDTIFSNPWLERTIPQALKALYSDHHPSGNRPYLQAAPGRLPENPVRLSSQGCGRQ